MTGAGDGLMDQASETAQGRSRSRRAARGFRLPGYEIEEMIGRGGFAVVYRAREVAFDRLVAIKVLNAQLDDEALDRFERECRHMGRFSGHPNIVTVHASGVDERDRAYLVMEHMTDGSLAERLERSGEIGWRQAAEVGVRLAGALETAHRAGILHRDVKPENVLVSRYGEPKLGDFGISRARDSYRSRSGSFHGTPLHAAPEVLGGKRASEASDVYSLASTLFALIRGRAAFEGEPDEEIVALFPRVADWPVPDLRPAGVPGALCEVVERAMAKDARQRHESAAAFGEELRRVQRQLGVPVTDMAIQDRLPPEAAPVTVTPRAPAPGPVEPPPVRPPVDPPRRGAEPARGRPVPPVPALAPPPPDHHPLREAREPLPVAPAAGPEAGGRRSGSGASDGRHGLHLEVDGDDLVVDPGGEAGLMFRVRNTGSLPDLVDVALAGIPEGWVAVDPARVELGVGASAEASVRIRPPRHHTTRPGRIGFDVVAWSSTNQRVRCAERRHVVVRRYGEAVARLEPVPGAARRAGVYELVVVNHGNATLQATVEAGDPESPLRVLCERRDLSVPPGVEVRVEVRAVPKQPVLVGRALVHRLRVLVSSPGDEPLAAETTFTQRPLLRPSR